jgi:hypothetical protein
MNNGSNVKFEKPSIIQALISGFNTIANRPGLMILPILLDLFLWFGPGWRVNEYFKPLIEGIKNLPLIDAGVNSGAVESYLSTWQELLANLDLAITLRTFPIGVPSLMASKPAFTNPLGSTIIFDLKNASQIIVMWILFLMVGSILGNLYYKNITKQVVSLDQEKGLKSFFRTLFQVIFMPLLLILVLIIIAIPFTILAALMTMLSPVIGEFFIFFAGLVILWILMPLIFTPHGVFLYKQNLIQAMITSINIVRISMGQTAWFILLSFVLIQGMNYLWQLPSANSWLLSFGIFGHAFMVTAVITASFFYFIDATKFAQSILNKNPKPLEIQS